MLRFFSRVIPLTLLLLCILTTLGYSQEEPSLVDFDNPIDVAEVLDTVSNPEQISTGILVLILISLLSLAPALIIMLTSFVRIIIVLSFTRTALATQSMPPYQVLVAIALFLSLFIMAPQFIQMYNNAWVPYQNEEIGTDELLNRGIEPLREFMLAQLDSSKGREALALFIELGNIDRPEVEQDIPTWLVIPAFMINELRIAFEMGVLIFIPFIIIDIIIASVLLSMGLIFLPPVLVSLPFKIILFVLVDGWRLLTETLVRSFVLP